MLIAHQARCQLKTEARLAGHCRRVQHTYVPIWSLGADFPIIRNTSGMIWIPHFVLTHISIRFVQVNVGHRHRNRARFG